MKRREEKRREEKSITLLTNILSFKLLIALLSILLFLINCKSNENPNTPEKPPRKKHELEGTWIGYDTNHHNSKVELKIDGDGNITLSPEPYLNENDLPVPYSYTGKLTVDNTFVYPFTAKVSNYLITLLYDEHECKLTFSNSSNCSADYMRAAGFKGSGFHADPTIVDFTKQ